MIEWLRKRAWEIHITRDSGWASRGKGSWHDAANIWKHSDEDFIGVYPLERTIAHQVVAILKNALLRINLNIQRARGQCYDGAATKAGEKTVVATQIKTINGKCFYTRCYGHASNLALSAAIKSLRCISDSSKTVRETGKLVKKSSKRNTKLDKIRAEARITHLVYIYIYQMYCAWRSISSSYQ